MSWTSLNMLRLSQKDAMTLSITILNADDWFFIVMLTRQRFKTNLAIANNLVFKQAVIRTKACLGESLNAAEWTCQACLNNFQDWISISKDCENEPDETDRQRIFLHRHYTDLCKARYNKLSKRCGTVQ